MGLFLIEHAGAASARWDTAGMNHTIGGAALTEYLHSNPEAQHAALHDPEFAAETHRLRTVLAHLDAALAAEGLADDARHRVGLRLVTELLGTDEANARIRNVRQLIAQGEVCVPAELR